MFVPIPRWAVVLVQARILALGAPPSLRVRPAPNGTFLGGGPPALRATAGCPVAVRVHVYAGSLPRLRWSGRLRPVAHRRWIGIVARGEPAPPCAGSPGDRVEFACRSRLGNRRGALGCVWQRQWPGRRGPHPFRGISDEAKTSTHAGLLPRAPSESGRDPRRGPGRVRGACREAPQPL